jgi:hypothetical protein
VKVGAHGNVGEALVVATRESGVQGLFRGTVATMAREVPFYVFGMMGYQSLKKLFSVSWTFNPIAFEIRAKCPLLVFSFPYDEG